MRVLLDHAAEMNAVDAVGRTPLWAASERGCADAVRALLERKADACAADSTGTAPIHVGASHLSTIYYNYNINNLLNYL